MGKKNTLILLRHGIAECSEGHCDIAVKLAELLVKEENNKPMEFDRIRKNVKSKSWILVDPYLEVQEAESDQFGGLYVLDRTLSIESCTTDAIVLSFESPETFFKRYIAGNHFRKHSLLNKAKNVFYLRMPFDINTLRGILSKEEMTINSWKRHFEKARFQNLFSSALPFTIAVLDDEPEPVKQALESEFKAVFGDSVRFEKDETPITKDFYEAYTISLRVFGKYECEVFLDEKRSGGICDNDIDLYLVDLFFKEASSTQNGAQSDAHPHPTTSDPRMMGFRLIKKIRKRREDARIVAVTAYKQHDKIIKSIGEGADWFFHKQQKDGEISIDGLIGVICGLYDLEVGDDQRVESSMTDKDNYGKDRIVDQTGWILDMREKQLDAVCRAKLYILDVLFPKESCDRITIIELVRGGLSGGDTLFVRPENKKGGYWEHQTVKVVKIGERFDLYYEKKNYEDIIDGCLDSFIGRVKGNMVTQGDFAGIVYTSVGTSENYKDRSLFPKPLKDFIERKVLEEGQESQPEPNKSVQKFLRTLLKPLHGTPRKVKVGQPGAEAEAETTKTVLDFYWEILPAWYRAKPENLGLDKKMFAHLVNDPRCRKDKTARVQLNGDKFPSVKKEGKVTLYEVNRRKEEVKLCVQSSMGKAKIDIFEHGQPEPELVGFLRSIVIQEVFTERLSKLTDLIENPVERLVGIIKNYNDEIHVSRIHGDFNLGNLLLTFGDGDKNYWLIDFAKTKDEGHTAFDFTKLELEIRTQILANEVGRFVQKTLIERPLNMTDLYKNILLDVYNVEIGKIPFQDVQPDSLQRVFRLIGKIRDTAIGEWGLTPKEYFLSLYLYSISALKFKNLRDKNTNPYAPLPAAIAYVTAAACAHRLKESFGI